MTRPNNPWLRRFWYPAPERLGIGVTAYSRQDADNLALAEAGHLGVILDPSAVIEDVDLSTLDQRHVIPNIGPVTFPGVWFPARNL